jgi:hypothetical protein
LLSRRKEEGKEKKVERKAYQPMIGVREFSFPFANVDEKFRKLL